MKNKITMHPTTKQPKREISAFDLRMFIQMIILGLKVNKNYPGLGDELQEIFEERFNQKLV